MELWNIRAWRNLKVKIVLSPQGDKTQEVFSQSNKASTGPEWETKFLNSKSSIPVITPEWPDLVISLQKGNRPSFVSQQKRTSVYRHQAALPGNHW